MTGEPATKRDWLNRLVGRPVLLVLWVLVYWGTFYGAVFLYFAWTDGPAEAAKRALSGKDVVGGVLNLGLVGFAALVWTLVILAVWRYRAKGRRLQQEELERRRARGTIRGVPP